MLLKQKPDKKCKAFFVLNHIFVFVSVWFSKRTTKKVILIFLSVSVFETKNAWQKKLRFFCLHFLSGQYFCFIFLSFICKPDIALTKKVSQRFSLSFLSEKIQNLTKTSNKNIIFVRGLQCLDVKWLFLYKNFYVNVNTIFVFVKWMNYCISLIFEFVVLKPGDPKE